VAFVAFVVFVAFVAFVAFADLGLVVGIEGYLLIEL
jgi:hypothetical protein